ncbi:membrane-bound lytic murein transglycosylase [Synechococcus sp. PCC 7502]|uniref:murein transglycosylase A n=1 Tax=Synechococcus sp. PCC 7502 TaxID=1173263 RepID=UPI00029FFD7B|nr:murein transglycosylase A [Synechococcus sp. PCC 7502]AFY73219.1 membrane-bound lytic murein transglycosylase [Synechococcus sp. PCC 7502]
MNLRNWAAFLGISMILLGLPTKVNAQGKIQALVKVSLAQILASDTKGLVDDLLASDRPALLAAIDHSLKYIRTPTASKTYPIGAISQVRMEQSLIRFRYLVQTSPTAVDLNNAVKKEFNFYKSVGLDRKGTVHFTGYYEAVYPASRTPTDVYKYPIYKLPSNFQAWTSPHPTRADLENGDQLKGLELAWLSDRLQAFLIQVQGSARLQLTDGTTLTVGYAGKTDRPYTSVGAELVKDGKIKLEELTLPRLVSYFETNPQDLNTYLQRNPSFVFFRETFMQPATGSIGVPVTAERSIATDKSVMPPGAIALISTTIPVIEQGQLVSRPIRRFVLDQDTGGAIKGAGRVDIFMGTGQIAKDRAGLLNNDGELYYLVLK